MESQGTLLCVPHCDLGQYTDAFDRQVASRQLAYTSWLPLEPPPSRAWTLGPSPRLIYFLKSICSEVLAWLSTKKGNNHTHKPLTTYPNRHGSAICAAAPHIARPNRAGGATPRRGGGAEALKRTHNPFLFQTTNGTRTGTIRASVRLAAADCRALGARCAMGSAEAHLVSETKPVRVLSQNPLLLLYVVIITTLCTAALLLVVERHFASLVLRF